MISLAELTALAQAQLAAERAVVAAESALSEAKERLRSLKEEGVPMAMLELDLKEFKLASGEKVAIKQDVFAVIPQANKSAAYAWLEANGFGGLIKTELALQFAKGEVDVANKVAEGLRSQGFAPDVQQSVHAQTLKAFLREQMENSRPVPLDLFGARPVWISTIKK